MPFDFDRRARVDARCIRTPMADLVALMARYCDGDSRAFRALYQEIAPRLQCYLVGMARDPAVAAELVQKTFLTMHHARAAYIRGADPVPWIYAFAHRAFLADSPRRPPPDSVGDSPGIEARLAALAELPPPQREAVVLKLEGKSITEAAEIAGTTISTMEVRTTAGCRALDRILRRATAGTPSEAGVE